LLTQIKSHIFTRLISIRNVVNSPSIDISRLMTTMNTIVDISYRVSLSTNIFLALNLQIKIGKEHAPN